MSTQPPNPPPPGSPQYGPPPGVDPRDWMRQQKEYWRAQKDSNRDYWRANRDQWRAQREHWRSWQRAALPPRRRSLLAPITLIGVGVIATLVYSGRIEAGRFWEWYGHWWPVLLILLGVFLLVEWLIDRGNPAGRTHGGLGWLIVILILGGIASSGAHHFRPGDIGIDEDDNDTMKFFRGAEHDFDGTTMATLPAGGTVQVRLGIHGDISVQPGTGDAIQVTTHKRLFRDSESEAQKKADALKPVITTAGNTTLIALDGDSSEQANLAITIPAGAAVQISNTRGDISVTGLNAAVTAQSAHGAVRVRDVMGPVSLRSDGGDLDLSNVRGTLDLKGKWDDVTVADVTGTINLDGDYEGDLSLRNTAQTHFHSSRTDLSTGRIAGQLTMDGEDLHMAQVAGPLKISTHGKEIELNDVSGDINITNADGGVDLTTARPLGTVQIQNRSGGIRLTLPSDAGFKLHAEARNGEITAGDFGMGARSVGDDHNLTEGTNGSGANSVSLSTEHGDISVIKSTNAQTVLDAPPAPAAPPAPEAAPATEVQKLSRVPKTPRVVRVPSAPPAAAPPAVVNQ